jgi:hypothetical protein
MNTADVTTTQNFFTVLPTFPIYSEKPLNSNLSIFFEKAKVGFITIFFALAIKIP